MAAATPGAGGVKARAPPIAEEARAFARSLRPNDRPRAEAALSALCMQLRQDGKAPLLDEYVRQSPLCVELFDLMESQEFEGGRALALVLEVLAFILEGAFEPGAQTLKTRSGVAGRVLSERLHGLYRCLSSERDHLLRACLRLLAGVVAQSSAFAAQLVRTFNFQHEGFLRLAGRRAKTHADAAGTASEDVRGHYVRFAMSFLRWRDPAVSAPALLAKGLFSHIFAGLKDDDPPKAVSFLTEMRELVVLHRQIPRHAKLFVFSSFSLRRLCGLLQADNAELASCVQQLVSELCADAFLFRAQQRQLLLDLCLDLRPVNDAHQEVVFVVLRAHPGVHMHFLATFQFAQQPRLSEQWVRNAGFLERLLELDATTLPAEAARAVEGQEVGAREMQLSWLLHVLSPRAVQKTLLTQALMHQDLRVMFVALLLLTALLSRIRRISDEGCVEPGHLQDALLRLPQIVPDLNTLLLLWQRLVQDAVSPPQGQKKKRRRAEDSDAEGQAGEDPEAPELDDAAVCRLLGRPEAAIGAPLVFEAWCLTVRTYIEVLPRSTLDVKFDWSKLLSTVAAPLLKHAKGDPPLAGATSRLPPCIATVEVAMAAGGRAPGMQLSKSTLAWIEALLRIRGAATKAKLGLAAVGIRELSSATLRRALCEMEIFGAEPAAEVRVWLGQLERRPECVPFFCEFLQVATSRPGAFAGLVPRSSVVGLGPSLFLVVALRHLARRDCQAGGSRSSPEQTLPWAQLIEGAACQLAMAMPQVAPGILSAAEQAGFWSASGAAGEASGGGGGGPATDPEGIRQALLSRLHELTEVWAMDEEPPAGAQASKRRRVADGARPAAAPSKAARAVADALRSTLSEDAARKPVGAEATEDVMLADLRDQAAQAVAGGAPHAHCGAYALLEGLARCAAPGAGDFRLATWYLLILIELIPALVASNSPALLHLIRHPIWAALLVEALPLPEAGDGCRSDERGACCAVALAFLCELLLACLAGDPAPERSTVCRQAFVSVLLPHWRPAAFGAAGARRILRRHARAADGRLAAWLRDFVGAATRAAVSLGLACDALGDVARAHLTSEPKGGVATLAAALLDANGEGNPPLLRLAPSLRAEVLAALARCAASKDTVGDGGNDLGGESEGGPRGRPSVDFGALLLRALALDRGGLLCLALARPDELPWVGSGHAGVGTAEQLRLTRGLVPLIKQACWVSPALRRKVAAKLGWQKSPPSAALALAACLAPLEGALPLMADAALESVSPESLVPLPSEQQLRRLLSSRPSPRLGELLRRAATTVLAADAAAVVSCEAALATEQGLVDAVAIAEATLEKEHRSEEALHRMALAIGSALENFEGDLPSRLRKDVPKLVKATAEASPQCGAILLSALLARSGADAPPTWQCAVAEQVIGEELPVAQPMWFLSHLALWWFHLRTTPRRRQLLLAIRRAYAAGCSPEDRVRRQILMSDAAGDDSAATERHRAADSADAGGPWSFRRWCGALRAWGADGGQWSWTLAPQRVRATADAFWYERRMADPAPWLHRQGAPKLPMPTAHEASAMAPGQSPPAVPAVPAPTASRAAPLAATAADARVAEAEAYDMGYLVFFLAGRLRAVWIEQMGDSGGKAASSAASANARGVLGPILGALISGGSLELLLLALACESESLRASAEEALAIAMAIAMLWSDAAQDWNNDKRARLPFRELPQVVRLLQYARDSLEPPGRKGGVPEALPPLVASFLSACLPVLCQPGHSLHMRLGLALCAQPSADLADVPMFYKLLLSQQADNHDTRVWMFRFIRRALVGRSHQDHEVAAADRLTRVALSRRYVVQWLLSFAGARELGSFALWSEAVSCLGAAVGMAAGTPLGFGVAEWVAGQVARTWPGASGLQHKQQALMTLTRLVAGLLRSIRATLSSPPLDDAKLVAATALAARRQGDVIALGDALKTVAVAWAQATPPFPPGQTPAAVLWESAHDLAELCKLCFGGAGEATALGNNIVEGTTSPDVIGRHALASQLAAILASLARAVAKDVDSASGASAASTLAAVVSRGEDDVVLLQAVDMLAACPLSPVLHMLIVDLLRVRLGGRALASGDGGGGTAVVGAELDHLSDEFQRAAVRALARASENAAACRETATLVPLVHTLVSLPYGLGAAWRVQLLACTVLLQAYPEAWQQEDLVALVGQLPEPRRAMAGMDQIAVIDAEAEAKWRTCVAELLGRLMVVCC